MIIEVEPDELLMDIPHDKNLLVIDVRRNAEFSEGHLPDALNLPLNEMGDVVSFAGLEEDQNLYIICSNGYRSVIAASILKKHGMHNLRNVAGGWERTKQEKGVKIEKDNNSLN
jgi:rhodanese-related sulfurtransferase